MNFKDHFLVNTKHLADKWESYLDIYARIFAPYQHRKVRILEIGVMNGGTLDVLAAYFPWATEIIGCDIDPKCGDLSFDDDRISVVVGDIKTVDIPGEFDIIIDDGSHICSDVIKTFSLYFPKLRRGGVYVIEDLHTSYWQAWGGGLNTPVSSVAFLKRLADEVNREHWRVSTNPIAHVEEVFGVKFNDLDLISSVMFANSMCVISKEYNLLGERIVTGSTEQVTDTGIWKEHNSHTNIRNIPAIAKDDSQYDQFNLIEMVRYLKSKT